MTSAAKIARKIIAEEPRFAPVIERSGFCPIGSTPRKESNFRSLATSIISQQLSTKAAATIIARVEKLTGGITPARIERIRVGRLREAGLSGTKARAIKELASAESEVRFSRLHLLEDDDAIFERLLPLFGIGSWTVEMFLIFQVGRPDVWPIGDLGVRRGWERIHRMKGEISPAELQKRGERFRPYRSHVAWYCWRALE
ncbi:MAG: DNA-3-methyladenine glycosylase family protein [Candidatus Nanopelagicaceae bacterium]